MQIEYACSQCSRGTPQGSGGKVDMHVHVCRQASHAILYGTRALALFRTAGLTYRYANTFACKIRILNEDLWCEIMYVRTGATKKHQMGKREDGWGNGGRGQMASDQVNEAAAEWWQQCWLRLWVIGM